MRIREIETERAAAQCGVPPRQSHQALAIFYGLLLLLNGSALLREAELMPYGRGRDICVALARPLAAVSELTRLDRPRGWIERTVVTGD